MKKLGVVFLASFLVASLGVAQQVLMVDDEDRSQRIKIDKNKMEKGLRVQPKSARKAPKPPPDESTHNNGLKIYVHDDKPVPCETSAQIARINSVVRSCLTISPSGKIEIDRLSKDLIFYERKGQSIKVQCKLGGGTVHSTIDLEMDSRDRLVQLFLDKPHGLVLSYDAQGKCQDYTFVEGDRSDNDAPVISIPRTPRGNE